MPFLSLIRQDLSQTLNNQKRFSTAPTGARPYKAAPDRSALDDSNKLLGVYSPPQFQKGYTNHQQHLSEPVYLDTNTLGIGQSISTNPSTFVQLQADTNFVNDGNMIDAFQESYVKDQMLYYQMEKNKQAQTNQKNDRYKVTQESQQSSQFDSNIKFGGTGTIGTQKIQSQVPNLDSEKNLTKKNFGNNEDFMSSAHND